MLAELLRGLFVYEHVVLVLDHLSLDDGHAQKEDQAEEIDQHEDSEEKSLGPFEGAHFLLDVDNLLVVVVFLLLVGFLGHGEFFVELRILQDWDLETGKQLLLREENLGIVLRRHFLDMSLHEDVYYFVLGRVVFVDQLDPLSLVFGPVVLVSSGVEVFDEEFLDDVCCLYFVDIVQVLGRVHFTRPHLVVSLPLLNLLGLLFVLQ